MTDPTKETTDTAGELIGPIGAGELNVWDGQRKRWLTHTEATHYFRHLPYDFYIWTPTPETPHE